jgi:hypothetical protein
MAITQDRIIAALTAANTAQSTIRAARSDFLQLSAQLAQSYAQGHAVALPYIMGEIDRLSATLSTPEPDLILIALELSHYKRESGKNQKRALALAKRRFLLGHESEATRLAARATTKPRGLAYPTYPQAEAAIQSRANATNAMLAGGTAAGATAGPAAGAIVDETAMAASLAAYREWNAGYGRIPAHVVVDLSPDLYTADPLADPALDPFAPSSDE